MRHISTEVIKTPMYSRAYSNSTNKIFTPNFTFTVYFTFTVTYVTVRTFTVNFTLNNIRRR